MSSNESHLQIRDFSDRELLAVIRDAGGKVVAQELAVRIFAPTTPETVAYYTRCVTSRLVWMRRYGLIEREAETGEWQISGQGERLRAGTLSESMETRIVNLGEDNSLALANTVGEKLVVSGEIAGRAMQRELVHQINRRRARLRGW